MGGGNPSFARTGASNFALAIRFAISAGLIGISVWGFGYSRRLMLQYIGSGDSPAERGFGPMGIWACWFLFFFPLALAGAWLLKGGLHKLGVGQLGQWFTGAGRQDLELAKGRSGVAVATASRADDPHGLETLNAETVAQLQRGAARAAMILGAIAGVALVVAGASGLIYLLFFFRPMVGSSLQGAFAVQRFSISGAVASGVSFLLGLALLRRTFTRESEGWLVPLQVFTRTVLRRFQLAQRRSPHSPPRSPKQLR